MTKKKLKNTLQVTKDSDYVNDFDSDYADAYLSTIEAHVIDLI